MTTPIHFTQTIVPSPNISPKSGFFGTGYMKVTRVGTMIVDDYGTLGDPTMEKFATIEIGPNLGNLAKMQMTSSEIEALVDMLNAVAYTMDNGLTLPVAPVVNEAAVLRDVADRIEA